MTYSNDDRDSTAPEDRDSCYYEWQAEMMTSDDLDTEVNESPANNATFEDDEDE